VQSTALLTSDSGEEVEAEEEKEGRRKREGRRGGSMAGR